MNTKQEIEMKKYYVIKIHSIIDVITNSSTEIFVSTHGKTIDLTKDLINNILGVAGSDKTADDLFEFKKIAAVDRWKKENPSEPIENYTEGDYGDDELEIVPLDSSKQTINLINSLQRIFSIEERYM